MMQIKVLSVTETEKNFVIREMQDAFQAQYEMQYHIKPEDDCLPREEIDEVLKDPEAFLYKAVLKEEIVGGAIVVRQANERCAILNYMYVRTDMQDQGIGTEMWKCIEKMHPEVTEWQVFVWIHDSDRTLPFYTRKCGFKLDENYENLPLEERGNCWPLYKRTK